MGGEAGRSGGGRGAKTCWGLRSFEPEPCTERSREVLGGRAGSSLRGGAGRICEGWGCEVGARVPGKAGVAGDARGGARVPEEGGASGVGWGRG